MAKGGARTRSGPAPDPAALRRDRDSAEWVNLPLRGRQGKVPEWPLENETDREAILWEREWKRPQAVMWERNGQEAEVAMYVRTFAAAEQMNATTACRTLVRQQQESLGISLPGLARNRWRIGGDEPAASAGPSPQSVRGRFKVVAGGAAA